MKLNYKLIGIAILFFLSYLTFKQKPLDEIELSDNLADVYTPVKQKEFIVDFEICNNSFDFEATGATGKTTFNIVGKSDTVCEVETGFENETGFFVNECQVPLTTGVITFDGSNFDQISQYCQINSTGTGLLELN